MPESGARNAICVSPVVQGPECLGRLLFIAQVHEQGAGLQVEQMGLKPEHTWDAVVITSGSLTCSPQCWLPREFTKRHNTVLAGGFNQ